MESVLLGCDPVGQSVIWKEDGFMSAAGTLPIAISDELRRSLLDWNERMGVLVRNTRALQPDRANLGATLFE